VWLSSPQICQQTLTQFQITIVARVLTWSGSLLDFTSLNVTSELSARNILTSLPTKCLTTG
jgi:hypothetical protein